ncbi:LysR family transcriptional regulator [Exercitatus varius]|uniref:LysR family transcriptional regulator n=1 Tax=Exercitatus varius TaxID=67857 RepID=UPI00294B73D5|nr:LysR family transcriptional regulator [Exercitatus varius]MDG2941617.1 LysR family transcriptional regulator [Exercitatus varius]
MQISSIRLFIELAKVGSFTRTAEHFNLSKSNVSKQIHSLENELGVRLLQRTSRTVRLTEEGKHYLERAIELEKMFDDVQGLFRRKEDQIQGKVTVGMSQIIAEQIFLPNFAEFCKRYPNIEIELNSQDRYIDLINEGVDCFIRTGELKDSNLVYRPLGRLRRLTCATPDYLEKHGVPQSLDDLSQHKLIQFSPNPKGFEYVKNNQTLYLPMPSTFSTNSGQTLIKAGERGLGIIQITELAVNTQLKQGKLLEILPNVSLKPIELSLLYPNRKNIPQRVQAVMNWLQDIVGESVMK